MQSRSLFVAALLIASTAPVEAQPPAVPTRALFDQLLRHVP